MAKIRFKGSTGEGGILEVGDDKLQGYLDSGKYEVYQEPRKIDLGSGNTDVGYTPPPAQRTINSESAPYGVVDIGGTTYKMEEGGRIVPFGEEFSEDLTRRRAEEAATQRRIAFGQQLSGQLESDKEKEQRSLESNISALKGTSGVTKGLGASSSEIQIISAVQDSSRRRIMDLEKAAKQAISNFDVTNYERVQNELATEREGQRKREETIFNRFLATKELGLKEKTLTQQLDQQKFENAIQKYNAQLEIPEGQTIKLSDGTELIGLKQENKALAKDIFDKYGDYLISQGITPDMPLDEAISAIQPLLKGKVDADSQKDLLSLDSIKADIASKRATTYKNSLEAQKLAGEITPAVAGNEKSKSQLDLLNTAMDKITGGDKLYEAAGAGVAGKTWTFLKGDSRYQRLGIQIDTIKTNLLTLATDPDVKKFFGPQMSERDVSMMTSAASTLNADSSPQDVKDEIDRIKPIINKLLGGIEEDNEVTVISPDGTEGTIPKSQLNDALKQGYKQK